MENRTKTKKRTKLSQLLMYHIIKKIINVQNQSFWSNISKKDNQFSIPIMTGLLETIYLSHSEIFRIAAFPN